MEEEKKEVTGEEKLDSPLVVHKKSDASYQETASEVSMYSTHTDDEGSDVPTLERHRFKKKKKSKKWPYIIFAIIAVGVAVVCALYYSGVISVGNDKETTTAAKKSYTTKAENKFEGVITIKGTYIFFEGKEVDGISGLEKEIKYLDENTSFTIQDEDADSNFLNYEVLSMLSDYGIDYKITHIVSSGLTSKYENMTTASTTKKAETTKKTTTKNNSTDN
ncbi:MAG: hypothetical protein ACI4IQ_04280 [Eubacterium sp.]